MVKFLTLRIRQRFFIEYLHVSVEIVVQACVHRQNLLESSFLITSIDVRCAIVTRYYWSIRCLYNWFLPWINIEVLSCVYAADSLIFDIVAIDCLQSLVWWASEDKDFLRVDLNKSGATTHSQLCLRNFNRYPSFGLALRIKHFNWVRHPPMKLLFDKTQARLIFVLHLRLLT